MNNSHTYHFISGLPRSGSTLLAAIFRQNPRFHAGMSSPVAFLIEGMIAQFSAGSEMATAVNDRQRLALARGMFDSYYAEIERAVILDSNRAWTAKQPMLHQLFPNAKLICCVRNVAWIMDSLERQYRRNAFENTRLFAGPAERASVYTRVDALAGANSIVGYAWHALREACWGEFAGRLVLVDYDLLVARPVDVMRLLYSFLQEEPFAHNFDAVEYDAPEFDAQLGLRGLHKVLPKVAPRQRTTLLPPDLFQRYASLSFWQDLQNSPAFRIVAEPKDGGGTDGTAPKGEMPARSDKMALGD